ncbi:MAG: hypothetical protein AB7S26_36375, partial [Sandaracinaceae bacterium]
MLERRRADFVTIHHVRRSGWRPTVEAPDLLGRDRRPSVEDPNVGDDAESLRLCDVCAARAFIVLEDDGTAQDSWRARLSTTTNGGVAGWDFACRTPDVVGVLGVVEADLVFDDEVAVLGLDLSSIP